MRHVTYSTYIRHDAWLIHMTHVTHMNQSCVICDMSHPYVWHVSSICKQAQFSAWNHGDDFFESLLSKNIFWNHLSSLSKKWISTFIWNSIVVLLFTHHFASGAECAHVCDMTHSYVWHDSFICVTWLIHMCDMTHSYVWRDPFCEWRRMR